jgi:hypothetical protein
VGSAGGIGDVTRVRTTPGLVSRLGFAAVAGLLFVAGFASASGGAPTTGAAASRSGPADFDTQTNGNFSVWIPQPTGTVVPGSYLLAEFSLSLVDPSSELPTLLNVWVPQTSATFSLSNVSVHVFHPAFEFNFTAGGARSSNGTNLTTLLKFTAEFNNSASAIFSSQLASVMTNFPYGAVTLSTSWRWAIAYPDGMTVYGDWSAPVSFEPAEYATLTSYGPATVAPGGDFQVCISTPEAGRQFSLHLETAVPYDDFVQVNHTVAEANESTCWEAAVAAWVTPQVILAHVWDYDRVTLLLFIIKVTVANQSPAWETFLAPLDNWSALISLGAVGVGVGLVLWGGRRLRPGPPIEASRSDGPP